MLPICFSDAELCILLKGLCPLQVNPTQAEFSHIQMQGTGVLLSQSCSSPSRLLKLILKHVFALFFFSLMHSIPLISLDYIKYWKKEIKNPREIR